MNIRPETASDAAAIEEVVRDAFRHAPHASGTEPLIVRDLRVAGALTLSLVAVDAARIVGYVAVSPVSVSDGSPGWHGLGPVAVAPSRQARGTGSALVREALRRLQEQGAAGCVVLGEPEYYGRFGFRAEPALRLEGVPPRYFQALPFGRGAARGMVTYHAAFGTTA